MPPALTRRAALGGALALTAAGATACTPSGVDRRPGPRAAAATAGRTDPDVALAAVVLADEQAMVDRLEATVAAHPDLTGPTRSALAAHRSHVALLREAVPKGSGSPSASPSAPLSASASGTDGATPTAAPTAGPGAVPHSAPAALRALARAEEQLVLVGKRSAFAAESGAFARVLAAMAAGAAQQAVVLAEAAR